MHELRKVDTEALCCHSSTGLLEVVYALHDVAEDMLRRSLKSVGYQNWVAPSAGTIMSTTCFLAMRL